MPKRRVLPDDVLRVETVPVGVQPGDGGYLACLECGRWYQALGNHLRAHELSPQEYRRRHQLPAGLPLLTAHLRQAQADRARTQYPTNEGLRAAQQPHRREASLKRAIQVRQESSTRTGSVLAQRERMQARSARVREQTRAGYEERARELGYTGLSDLLVATDHLRDLDLGALLGVAESTAGRIRLQYGQQPARDAVQRRVQQIRRGTRYKYDERARQVGYPDITRLLAANADLPVTALAALLSTSVQTASRLRNDPRMTEPAHD